MVYLTIDDSQKVITDICDVCFWQYDEVAQNTPDSIIGENNAFVQDLEKYNME